MGYGFSPPADKLPHVRIAHHHCAFTNIEAGRCFHTDCQSLAHQDRSLIGDCDHALHVFPCRRFDVGPRHLRGLGYGRFQGGSWAYHSPQWPVRIRGLRPTQANPSSPFG